MIDQEEKRANQFPHYPYTPEQILQITTAQTQIEMQA